MIFCLGTSEFMIAGILEPLSADLDVTIPQAGLLITGFAVGMIVGAPAMTLLTLTLPRRATMIVMIIGFSALHILAALSPSYGLLMVSRVLSAFACGGFWAVAAVHTSAIAPAAVQGRALASLVGGLTVANLVGVPMGTWIGTQFGWRSTFWAVALVTALAAVLIAVTTRTDAKPTDPDETGPDDAGSPTLTSGSPSADPAACRDRAFKGRIWLALGTIPRCSRRRYSRRSPISCPRSAGLCAELPADLVPRCSRPAFGVGAFVGCRRRRALGR